jgi:extradiol dioxygenase family protein
MTSTPLASREEVGEQATKFFLDPAGKALEFKASPTSASSSQSDPSGVRNP